MSCWIRASGRRRSRIRCERARCERHVRPRRRTRRVPRQMARALAGMADRAGVRRRFRARDRRGLVRTAAGMDRCRVGRRRSDPRLRQAGVVAGRIAGLGERPAPASAGSRAAEAACAVGDAGGSAGVAPSRARVAAWMGAAAAVDGAVAAAGRCDRRLRASDFFIRCRIRCRIRYRILWRCIPVARRACAVASR